MDLLPQLVTQIVGGGGAAYLDRAKPQWTKFVGKSATSPGVAVTPGAMAAVGTAVLLAVLPGKAGGATAPMWKQLLANAAGGALVYEGVKLAEHEIIPRIESAMHPAAAPGAPAPAAFMAPPGVYGMPQYGSQVSDQDLRQTLAQYRANPRAYARAA